jgi:hypothetical protein
MESAHPHRSSWTLLRRPYWIGLLAFIGCFAVLYFSVRPHTVWEFAVSAASALGYFFLIDYFNHLLFPAGVRRLGKRVFIPLAFLLTVLIAVGISQAGKRLGLETTLTDPVRLMFFISSSMSLGALLASRTPYNQNAA